MTDASNVNSTDKLDVLTEQVGRMTEGITEFRLSMERSSTEFRNDLAEFRKDMADFRVESERSSAEFRKDMAELKATVQRQAETTDRLVRIVETLIQR